MVIKVNKKINIYNIIYFLSFYAILFCILFLKWFNNSSPDKFILIATCILLIMNVKNHNKHINKKQYLHFILLMITILYIIINILFSDSNKYAMSYLIDFTLIPYMSLSFIAMLKSKQNKELENKILNSLFWILNIYNIVNIFIISKQISTPGFMVRNYTSNTFYTDMIAGLLGANGTHKLTLFYLICLFLNIYNFDDNKKYKRISAKIFFTITLISSLYISNFNDNRTYYFILLVYMLPLIIKYIRKNFIRNKIQKYKILKLMIFIPGIILSLNILYNNNADFKNIIDETVKKNIERTFGNISRTSDNEKGGEERLELLKFALNEGNGYSIGTGIGSIPVTGDTVSSHFGINDCNVRIYSGGIIFLLLIILVYTNRIYQLFDKKNNYYRVFIIITLIILSFYTQVFSYCDKTILAMFIYYIIAAIENKK